MRILAIDSSAVTASACIVNDGKIEGEYFVNTKQKHSRTLMPMVGHLLESTNVKLNEIDLFGVSHGPGSFTGIRIGISCVKGLAMPQNTPCAGVSSLLAMAYNLTSIDGIICSVMDARCGQVYGALFSSDNGTLCRLTQDMACSIETMAAACEKYKKKIFLVGDGAQLCYNKKEFYELGAVLVPEQVQYQRASGVAFAALAAYTQGETVLPEQLSPVYLRPAQAQRELAKRLGEQK